MIDTILNTSYDEPFSGVLKSIQKCALENNIPNVKHI